MGRASIVETRAFGRTERDRRSPVTRRPTGSHRAVTRDTAVDGDHDASITKHR
jgi:hypothetical protein